MQIPWKIRAKDMMSIPMEISLFFMKSVTFSCSFATIGDERKFSGQKTK